MPETLSSTFTLLHHHPELYIDYEYEGVWNLDDNLGLKLFKKKDIHYTLLEKITLH